MSDRAGVDRFIHPWALYIECLPSHFFHRLDHRQRRPSPSDLASLPTVALAGLLCIIFIIIIILDSAVCHLSHSLSLPPHASGCALAHGIRAGDNSRRRPGTLRAGSAFKQKTKICVFFSGVGSPSDQYHNFAFLTLEEKLRYVYPLLRWTLEARQHEAALVGRRQ